MTYLQIILNAILLFLGIRIFTRPQKAFYFNPFISAPMGLLDRWALFLRPVFPFAEQIVFAIIFLAIFFVKVACFMKSGTQPSFTIGRQIVFLMPFTKDAMVAFPQALLCSVFDCIFFLFRFWCVYLFVNLLTGKTFQKRALEAYSFLCRPLSRLPIFIAPIVLFIAILVLLVLLLNLFPDPTVRSLIPTSGDSPIITLQILSEPFPVLMIKLAWLGVLFMVDALYFANMTLFVAILGNIACALLSWHTGNAVCSEIVDMLLGRFSRKIGGGVLDFTPIVYYFVLSTVHSFISNALVQMLQMQFTPQL